MKRNKLTESDLNRIIKKVLKEEEYDSKRYMFFSNLEQMRRQCDILLEMNPDEVESIGLDPSAAKFATTLALP